MRHATMIGFIAILLWSFLAVLTVGSAPVPPLQLNAMCFAIGGTIGLLWVAKSGTLITLLDVPRHVYLLGTAGLFGYHFLYFTALRLAPAAEAGLIAYLWPLLIVLMSGLLPNERLGWGHIVGGLIGFSGAALILSNGIHFDQGANIGYLVALACAFTWSSYSFVSRGFGHVPTSSVAVFCIATAGLSAIGHAAFEITYWPTDWIGWLSITALGVGPVGLAFYVWDIGVKKGDIQLLGVASYAAPVLSTLILIAFGFAQPTPSLLLAALLISGGAALAARASAKMR